MCLEQKGDAFAGRRAREGILLIGARALALCALGPLTTGCGDDNVTGPLEGTGSSSSSDTGMDDEAVDDTGTTDTGVVDDTGTTGDTGGPEPEFCEPVQAPAGTYQPVAKLRNAATTP